MKFNSHIQLDTKVDLVMESALKLKIGETIQKELVIL